MCLLAQCVNFSANFLFKSFAHFPTRFFIVLDYLSFSYIMENKKPLLGRSKTPGCKERNELEGKCAEGAS
jgi:hypothetical protein